MAGRRAVRVVDGHRRQGSREWPRRVDDERPDVALLVFMGAAFAGVVTQAVIDRLCPEDGVQRVNGGGRVTRAIRGHRTTRAISCRKA